jgi:hypothetical protein
MPERLVSVRRPGGPANRFFSPSTVVARHRDGDVIVEGIEA